MEIGKALEVTNFVSLLLTTEETIMVPTLPVTKLLSFETKHPTFVQTLPKGYQRLLYLVKTRLALEKGADHNTLRLKHSQLPQSANPGTSARQWTAVMIAAHQHVSVTDGPAIRASDSRMMQTGPLYPISHFSNRGNQIIPMSLVYRV